MNRFLLDTGLLLGFSRNAPWAIGARETHDLGDPETMVFTSVICQGEILALAEKNGWGTNRRGRLEQLLDQIPRLNISRKEIIGAYAQIDAWTHGNSVGAPNNAPPPRPAIPMTQNAICGLQRRLTPVRQHCFRRTKTLSTYKAFGSSLSTYRPISPIPIED